MKTVAIIVGVLVLILGVGYLVTSSPAEPAAVTADAAPEPGADTGAASAQASTTPVLADAPTPMSAAPSEPFVEEAGVYTTYDADAIAASDAEHILLFFHATWCPSCRALDADITENADQIPPNVEIYKIDYDTATALKRQYGVTTQHSILEISTTGEAESGISHGITLDDVLATI